MSNSSPNVLLIVVDAARARNFSLYGHSVETSPFLDEFADQATVYTQARAPSVWTLPSHASMFTGLHVPEHNVTSQSDKLTSGNSIWETLRDVYEYDTGVFANNLFLTSEKYGLHHGFDRIDTDINDAVYPFNGYNPRTFQTEADGVRRYLQYALQARKSGSLRGGIANGILAKLQARKPRLVPAKCRKYRANSEKYADAFLNWQKGRNQWAACINITDAHHPYLCSPDDNIWGDDDLLYIHDEFDDYKFDFYEGKQPLWKNRALEALYDGCIHQADRGLEKIISEIERRGVLDETLVIITADHGEAFGEQDALKPNFHHLSHLTGIPEVLLHVPLLVRAPGQDEGDTIERVASLTAFPEVVKAAVTGDDNVRNKFTPDGAVLAAMDADARIAHHLETESGWDLGSRPGIDPSLFQGYGRAVYESRDSYVRKYAEWGERRRTIDIYDAQTSVPRNSVSESPATVIDKAYKPLSDTDVCVRSGAVEDQAQIEQLKHLGYM